MNFQKPLPMKWGSYLSQQRSLTVDILRKKLAALDGAEDCLVFNNGAASHLLQRMANVKSEIILWVWKDPYVWTKKAFQYFFTFRCKALPILKEKRHSGMAICNTINTVLYYLRVALTVGGVRVAALAGNCRFCKNQNIITIIDNTYCTPIYQNVIEMVLTLPCRQPQKIYWRPQRYMGGVLCGSHAMMRKILKVNTWRSAAALQLSTPGHLSVGCTLPARLERINQTTKTIVEFLSNHPKSWKIIFPFHPSFPPNMSLPKANEGKYSD